MTDMPLEGSLGYWKISELRFGLGRLGELSNRPRRHKAGDRYKVSALRWACAARAQAAMTLSESRAPSCLVRLWGGAVLTLP
jgi:hypothetical protein